MSAFAWDGKAKRLGFPDNYYRGHDLPAGFRLPSSLLLYRHTVSHERTIISTRHMLIIPVAAMEYRVSGRPVALRPGEALLIPPYLQRSVPERPGGIYDRLMVSFSADPEQSYMPKELVSRATPKAHRLIGELVDAYLAGDWLQALTATARLLGELSRHPLVPAMPALSEAVSLALSRIHSEPTPPDSVKRLAAAAGLSASHMRRVFRGEMGISLGAYLAERRLDGARHLLANSDLPIGEVGRRCGYDSPYAFSRFFRNRTGRSPRAFRQRPTPPPPG